MGRLGDGTAGFTESSFVPLAVAAALALAGVATRIRLVVALAGLIGLTTIFTRDGRTRPETPHWLIIATVLLPRRRTADTT